jgi:hypothetical protein
LLFTSKVKEFGRSTPFEVDREASLVRVLSTDFDAAPVAHPFSSVQFKLSGLLSFTIFWDHDARLPLPFLLAGLAQRIKSLKDQFTFIILLLLTFPDCDPTTTSVAQHVPNVLSELSGDFLALYQFERRRPDWLVIPEGYWSRYFNMYLQVIGSILADSSFPLHSIPGDLSPLFAAKDPRTAVAHSVIISLLAPRDSFRPIPANAGDTGKAIPEFISALLDLWSKTQNHEIIGAIAVILPTHYVFPQSILQAWRDSKDVVNWVKLNDKTRGEGGGIMRRLESTRPARGEQISFEGIVQQAEGSLQNLRKQIDYLQGDAQRMVAQEAYRSFHVKLGEFAGKCVKTAESITYYLEVLREWVAKGEVPVDLNAFGTEMARFDRLGEDEAALLAFIGTMGGEKTVVDMLDFTPGWSDVELKVASEFMAFRMHCDTPDRKEIAKMTERLRRTLISRSRSKPPLNET